jgi:hypothetical protein
MKRLIALIDAVLQRTAHPQEPRSDKQATQAGKTNSDRETLVALLNELRQERISHHKQVTEQQQRDEEEGGERYVDRQRLAVERRTFWAAFLGAIVSTGTLILVKLSTQAAIDAANAANAGLLETRRATQAAVVEAKSSQMAQRAWVHTVQQSYFADSVNGVTALRGQIPIINSGHIPARKIDAAGAVDLLDRNQSPSFSPQTNAITTRGVLFPQEKTSVLVINANPDKTPVAVTAKDRQALLSGEKYLVVYGEIIYDDEFGTHWTRYCYWKNYGPGNFAARSCSEYNSVGEGAPPPPPKK